MIGRGQNDNSQKRMWQFDPVAQGFSEFGSYPCAGNSGKFHFIIDDKLYVGLGNEFPYSYFDNKPDIWEYDLINNSWSCSE